MPEDQTSTESSIAPSKNILGYTLKERVGAGGFGEVWSAEAPGGMLKAVKIVYGYHDEKRAQGELKALDRVKQLRHPFLLSLERIEIFEGQLIVVSELADKSMADLFNELVIKGESGIPRERLLKYMRDAADALDYLSDEHSLQHLDVKPENLLIVGSHVKVADFGLVKELHSDCMSLMTGMTPAYAAPELFDGRPGAYSDQYSLAIVYQEMLTSIRPFPGSTPAQLAAQHVHGKPNLRPLPSEDRATIARALSKDPNVRFASCLDMIEDLANRKRVGRKSIKRIQRPTESTPANADAPDMTVIVDSQGLPFQANQIETLEPPECDASQAVARPTLIIGIGSTGNRVVHQMKQQLDARHGSNEAIPSVRLLAIDSDIDDLSALSNMGDQGALSVTESLHTALRTPEFYRDEASSTLSWLSRRWIYNIPRSQNTEGLRPLGRLLFASYFESIYQTLQTAIDEMVLPENLAATADTLGMNPGSVQPRVFLVSSISGGIGSGMILDLAYTVKLLMAERGLSESTVNGMLLHSTYQRNRDPGLSSANAFACLTELRHFVESGYPGDETLGIPDFEDEMPFDHTYFRHMGNDLSQSEYKTQIASVAEYIYLSTVSKCSVFFDACHNLATEQEHFALRTCGLSVSGPGNMETGVRSTDRLSLALIRQWIFGDPTTETDAKSFVSELLERNRLKENLCYEDVSKPVYQLLAGTPESVSSDANEQVLRSPESARETLVAYVDGIFGCQFNRQNDEYQEPEICSQFLELIENKSKVVGDEVCESILSLMQQPQFELSTVNVAREECQRQLVQMSDKMEAIAAEGARASGDLLSMLAQLPDADQEMTDATRGQIAEIVSRYVDLRFQEFAAGMCVKYYRGCRSRLTYVDEKVNQFRRQLETICDNFSSGEGPRIDLAGEQFSMDRLLAASIEKNLQANITKTETLVYENLILERGGYLEAMASQSCWYHRLPGAIRSAAQQVLADAYKKMSLEKVIVKNNVRLEQLVKWLDEKIKQARPVIDDCGGASRILIGLPILSTEESTLPELMKVQFAVPTIPINGTLGNVVICFEGEDVSLASVAYRLLESRPDAIELVKRLHTRNDVNWSTLNDLL